MNSSGKRWGIEIDRILVGMQTSPFNSATIKWWHSWEAKLSPIDGKNDLKRRKKLKNFFSKTAIIGYTPLLHYL
jgi:hypothetical protein